MNIKKLISVILALSMLTAIFAGITVSAESISGSCGENVTWYFDAETGVLTISGIGKMQKFDFYDELPWKDMSIQTVVIESGVTSIGDHAFAYCGKISDVYYSGTEEQWNAIDIGTDNDCLTNANIQYGDDEEIPVIKGDIDGDGRINLKDTYSIKAIILGAWLVEPTSDEFIAADMNGDGKVNTIDAFLLKVQLLKEQ